MISPSTLAACLALDWWWGDPEWFPHPVRMIGSAAARMERVARRFVRSERDELWAGALVTAAICGAAFGFGYMLERHLERRHSRLGKGGEVLLAWTTIALRNLLEEAEAVISAAEAGDLTLCRQRLARIVGRDTADLDEREIARAVIETLAESTCDGVIAPMFYLWLGSAPWALMYKAVNTLDSMIGHRDRRYLYFGRAAARADDVANFIPARITATAISISSFLFPMADGLKALRTWWRDGHKHASPNAGCPEAAIAGALSVRLGGGNYYDGDFHLQPHLGDEFRAPRIADARHALVLCGGASLLTFAVALGIAIWSQR
jgi:adenosylcobinamide-phosphate synthase